MQFLLWENDAEWNRCGGSCLKAQHFGGWGRERIDINLSLAGLKAKSVFQQAKFSKTRVWHANNMASLAWSQTASGWITIYSELSLTWSVTFKEGHIILPLWTQALPNLEFWPDHWKLTGPQGVNLRAGHNNAQISAFSKLVLIVLCDSVTFLLIRWRKSTPS